MEFSQQILTLVVKQKLKMLLKTKQAGNFPQIFHEDKTSSSMNRPQVRYKGMTNQHF
jgi:hypothetical protein